MFLTLCLHHSIGPCSSTDFCQHLLRNGIEGIEIAFLLQQFLSGKEPAKHGVIQSMSRKGNCYDNCIMEIFFSRLKNEMFYGFKKESPSFEAFQNAIAEYIDYYNNRRIQAKTKWMSPFKFREASMMNC